MQACGSARTTPGTRPGGYPVVLVVVLPTYSGRKSRLSGNQRIPGPFPSSPSGVRLTLGLDQYTPFNFPLILTCCPPTVP
eukprot:266685-Rhodomonas_salina.1